MVLIANASPRASRPALKQPTFNWKVTLKYHKLVNFKMEVNNIFMIKSYDKEASEELCYEKELMYP